MLDVLVPCPHQNLPLVPDCLDALRACTDVPFRVLVMVDGAVEEDLRPLQNYLNAFEPAWRLTNDLIAIGLNAQLNEGLDDCVQKITAIVSPETRLGDKNWVGKIKQVFDRDPICGIIDLLPGSKSRTSQPFKRPHNRHPDPGCRFAVVQTNYGRKTKLYGLVDPVVYWAKMVHGQGGSSWFVPGVNYEEVDHHDHELWRPKVAASS